MASDKEGVTMGDRIQNKKKIITTMCGLLVGTCVGTIAFFNGWLG